MSQDRVKDRINKVKGKGKVEVEEELGRAVGDRSTEWPGKLDRVKGSFQERIGQAKLDTRRFADGLRVR